MRMKNTATITLPGGFWIDGERHQEVGLCPLTGRDLEQILEAGRSFSHAERATSVLARCITHLGPLNPVTSDNVRLLTVGDREALLLHLRRLTFGDRLDCVLNCPQDGCEEKMGLELAVSNLMLPPYQNARETYEATISDGGKIYHVKFRLPTGCDQEKAARLVESDPQTAAEQLLQSCVLHVSTDGDLPIEGVPSSVKEQLPHIIAELDPQAEISINITCTACGNVFRTILDAGTYFFGELGSHLSQLYNEVHLLAYHYHWSETEIMSMSTAKRHRYCNLLLNALSGERQQ